MEVIHGIRGNSRRKWLLAGAAYLFLIGGTQIAQAQAADDGDGAPQGVEQPAPALDETLQSEVDRSLSDAAGTASSAMNDLLAAEGAGGASSTMAHINVQSMPPEMQRPITLAWTGPADQAVSRIAQSIGYSFYETGKVPVVPDLVVVRYTAEPAVVVLQDIGLRVSKTAQVSVDTTARSITFENNEPQPIPVEGVPAVHQNRPGARMPQKLMTAGG
jgi:hypothetical protein